MLERHSEAVFTVRRKRVHDRRATARSERSSLYSLGLGSKPRDSVGPVCRPNIRITYSEAANLTRRIEIGVQQSGRQHLRFRDVVEVGTLRIEGKIISGVDLHS